MLPGTFVSFRSIRMCRIHFICVKPKQNISRRTRRVLCIATSRITHETYIRTICVGETLVLVKEEEMQKFSTLS